MRRFSDKITDADSDDDEAACDVSQLPTKPETLSHEQLVGLFKTQETLSRLAADCKRDKAAQPSGAVAPKPVSAIAPLPAPPTYPSFHAPAASSSSSVYLSAQPMHVSK